MKTSRLLFFLLLSFVDHILATFSGLYVDNGKGQTVMQRGISRREKLQFERDMLDLLGLPRKPRRTLNSTDLTSSAPKFLLDLYKSLDGSKMEDDFNLKKEDLRSIKESDSIMTFLSKNDQVNSVRHERGNRLWFNVSDVPVGDTLVAAEVRLYKISNEDEVPLTVTMYQVIEDLNGQKELAYTDAVNVTRDYEGWLVFNVTPAFVSWVAFPSSNRGLYISVQKQSKSKHEVHPETVGIISVVYEEDVENQPFMVAFFKYNSNRLRRSVREAPKKRNNRKSEPEVSHNNGNPFNSEPAWTLRNCQIQSLYVNFKDLNWHDWIIAPDGYAAYYCSGLCDFPLNAHMNATNHAIVQTLVHLINPAEAPKPCCAPTKLGSIAVLYYMEDNNVILKKYKNMIAKSCGCH